MTQNGLPQKSHAYCAASEDCPHEGCAAVWRIGRVLLRYRLDDLLDDTPAERWLKLMRPFVPRASREVAAMSRGARLRLALQELGPIFVSFRADSFHTPGFGAARYRR